MISPEQLPLVTVTAVVGLFVGTLMTWLLVSAKNKAQAAVDAEKLSAEQQRVEASTRDLAELQLQFEKLQDEDRSLRKEHTELEVRLEQEKKAAVEKQALLERAELRLTDTFKALSAETLKSTQDQFLSLAKNSLKMQQQEANSELEKRKLAVEQMVKPISETLEKVQNQITQSDKAREGDNATLKQQITHITQSNQGLENATKKLVKALRQPTGRGQWGEMQLKHRRPRTLTRVNACVLI